MKSRGERQDPHAGRHALMIVDSARTATWSATLDDLSCPSYTRVAALTHLAVSSGEAEGIPTGLHEDVVNLLGQLGLVRPRGATTVSLARTVIAGVLDETALGAELIGRWIEAVTTGQVSYDVVAVWLASLCHRRLSEIDLTHLTAAMVGSGDIFDYRDPCSYTVRRYPTGGISEKLALILPALLAEAAQLVPVKSAFLVARSLAHTGGTWDKLSSIPGFAMPRPGAETRATMASARVAMVASIGTFCPADRLLYSMRSLTDTVESTDLIVSSITSKLCAALVEDNVLDVRYGPHSFLPNEESAAMHAALVVAVAARQGVVVRTVLREDTGPDGSAIGNAVEVAESLAVLGLTPTDGWDLERVTHQREVAAAMIDTMLGLRYPEVPWNEWAMDQMTAGRLRRAYSTLMVAHGVTAEGATALLQEPSSFLGIPAPTAVVATSSGLIADVAYSKIGAVVNQDLAKQRLRSDGREADESGATPTHPTAGVILRAQPGEHVVSGETLLTIHSDGPPTAEIVGRLRAAYRTEEGN